jgi:hypothetical protein
MSYKPIRIADIEIDGRAVALFRFIFPFWCMFVIRKIRSNQRQSERSAKELGETAARVVIQAQEGTKTLRRLTVWLVALTLVNTAFVIYSALK